MSYLSLLFASNTDAGLSRTPGVVAGNEPKAQSLAWPQGADTAGYAIATNGSMEQALPSGVASMEHWLDLNA